MRTICIGVDDFGLHAGINSAALQLAALGRVGAIGCMVGGAAWPAGAGALRPTDADRVDIGLHLDLTELPLLARTRRGLLALIIASQSRTLSHQAVRGEIRAQLDAFEQGMGRAPAFVDGHQHVHQFPVVRDELVDELESRYGACRPWLRSTLHAPRTLGPRLGWREAAKARIIQALGARALAALARQRGHALNRRLLGVYDFHGGAQRYRELLQGWLQIAADSDLLMCHPSLRIDVADPLLGARTAEFKVLAGAGFAALLREAGVQLRPMSEILRRIALSS